MLILLRHGQSEWNNTNLFCGWTDVKLTPQGEDQAAHSAELLAENLLLPDVVYTSKLTRACQTAYIIAQKLDRMWMAVHRTWRLNERHYGALQGRKKSDVVKEVGKDKYMFWRRGYDGCPPKACEKQQAACVTDNRYDFEDVPVDGLPKGESLRMVVERVRPYWENVIRKDLELGKVVLVVTHGSVVRSFIKILSEVGDQEIEQINIPNGVPLVYDVKNGHVGKDYYYLDPQIAEERARQVAGEGLS